jgi:hypothetical protein
MAGHRGSQWTVEEDRRLLDLIRMKKSWVLISAALSRNVKSIRDRARHLERQAKMEAAGPDAAGSERDKRPSKLRPSAVPERHEPKVTSL